MYEEHPLSTIISVPLEAILGAMLVMNKTGHDTVATVACSTVLVVAVVEAGDG